MTAPSFHLPPSPRTLRSLIAWAWSSWATRSLALGGVATLLDVCILLLMVKLLHLPNPVGAMIGVAVGSTFTFFANKYFAFRDQKPGLAPQALKFVLATGAGMIVHAAIVYELADRHGVPVVLAKLGADILVFSVGQLVVLRYLVFPQQPETPSNSQTKPSFRSRRTVS